MPEEIILKPQDSILVCRTDRLGDLVLALPFIETLKVRYPECRIDVMASDYASPLLENNKCINNVIKINRTALKEERSYRDRLCEEISGSNYRAALALFPDPNVSRILFRSKIPYRIGTVRRFHSFYFNRFLFRGRKANSRHESECNLDFLRFFKAGDIVYLPRIYLRESELAAAKKLLSEAGIGGNFIVLNPGSGGSAERWPLENFLELYYLLTKEHFRVVLTGGDEERRGILEISDKLKIPVINLTGMTDIRTLAAILAQADAVVANSTGPLHIATAVGTRVIGLYPRNRAMSPVRWGPLGSGHRIIMPPDEGGGRMELIKPVQVAEVVKASIRRSGDTE